jgi:hypothetical protein
MFNSLVRQRHINESPTSIEGFINTNGHDMIVLNDKYVIRALHSRFEISCFGDSPEHTFTDGNLFGIGSSTEVNMTEHMQLLRLDD